MTAETGASVDLAAFLLARIQDEEKLAQDCIDVIGNGNAGDPFDDGSGVRDYDDYPSYPWGSQEVELAFMAAFGPARVLAESAAKRRIIEFATEGMCAADCGPGCCWTVLKLMAQPHSAHPDFNADWAVA